MKYVIEGANDDIISLEAELGEPPFGVTITSTYGDDEHLLYFNEKQFKELRRAVGYVWQEINGSNE